MKWTSISIFFGLYLVWFFFLAGVSQVVSAAEVAAFRLSDLNAFFESNTSYTENQNSSLDVETTTRQPIFERELGLGTGSYVYHPNLLELNISGSLIQQSSSYTLERTSSLSQLEDEVDLDDFTWNFASLIRILKKKPYPLTLFYNRTNPIITANFAENFRQEHTDFGFRLLLKKPFSPITMQIGAIRVTEQGESTLQLVDETKDKLFFNAHHRFAHQADVSFRYNLNRRESISGSPALPIQAVDLLDQLFILNSSWVFGNKRQYMLRQFANLELHDFPDRTDSRYSPTLNWTHSPRLRSYYSYDFSARNSEGDFDSQQHAATADVTYTIREGLGVDFGVGAEHSEEASDLVLRIYDISGNVNYQRPVYDGQLSLGLAVIYSLNDQESDKNQIDIRDEPHTLNGTTPVTLEREFVIESTVVVTNTARTQTFVEDLDYRLFTIGSQTQLQRLIAGNILDGETVLVSYAIDTGNTLSYDSLQTQFNAELSLARYYSLFLTYNDLRQSQDSGIESIRLNSVRFFEIGATADVPLPWWGMTVGGDTLFRYNDEDISSYDSVDVSAYLQLPLPYRSFLSLNSGWGRTNNHNSPEDSRGSVYSASLSSQPWHRLNLSASVSHEIDSGGSLEFRRTDSSLNADWQYRRLRVDASVTYRKEKQGTFESDGLSAKLTMRRDFW